MIKTFSTLTVLLFVASGLVPVFAAPLPELQDLAARDLTADGQKAVKWLENRANAKIINEKEICFFSGSSKIGKARVFAYEKVPDFAKELEKQGPDHGCKVIKDILSLAVSSTEGFNTADWKAVSKALALAITKPTAKVLLGQTVDTKISIWSTVELPALRTNKNVKKVNVYELAKDGSFVYKKDLSVDY